MNPTNNAALLSELAALRDEFITKLNLVIGKYTKPTPQPEEAPPTPEPTPQPEEAPPTPEPTPQPEEAPPTPEPTPQPEEAPPTPQPTPQPEEAPPTTYHSAGLAAIQAASLEDTTKAQYTRVWGLCIPSTSTLSGDEAALWSHMLGFCRNQPGLVKSARSKYMSTLFAIASKHMGLKEPRHYKELRTKLESEVESEKKYTVYDDAKLTKMLAIPNTEGKLLTTAYLRSIVSKEVQEMKKDPAAYELSALRKRHPKKSAAALQKLAATKGCTLDLGVLAFFAHHGHRQQDILIAYGEANKDTTSTDGCCVYYNPKTTTLHLQRFGKEKATYPDRKLVLHDDTAAAFRVYHEGASHKHLIPPCSLKNPFDANSEPISNPSQSLRDRFEKIILAFGLPKVNLTNLRALWELHTRFVENMPEDQLNALWYNIGHSPDTALAWYNQKFSGLLKHPGGYALSQSELPPVLE